ncbi:hypothetical protein Tco_1133240 [Tanacetum coccineum]
MESFLSDIGFSSLHNVFIESLPQRFARFVVRAFSASSYEFKLEMGIICVTPEKVHEILGVPLGGTSIFDLPEISLDDPFVKEWFKQFDPKPLKEIRACDIAQKLVLSKTVDFMFKVNFLMLFTNVMGTADTMKEIVNLTVLRSPYLDSTKFDKFLVIRQCPSIQNSTTTAMNRRQELEIEEQVIGKLELHGEWTESELDQTEGFYVVENVSRTRTSSVPPTDKKESVVLEDFHAYIDDFDNNDNDGAGKNDDLGFDNVGKKKESAAKDVGKKDGVNAEKDGVNYVQEGEAHVNEELEDML